ncbi:hypothetical protein ACFQY3_02435 [Paenibacillus farraposensis]|nr:hypothetical protein [Paenibacillus farraposensis]
MTDLSLSNCAPGMGDNLAVKVRYRQCRLMAVCSEAEDLNLEKGQRS